MNKESNIKKNLTELADEIYTSVEDCLPTINSGGCVDEIAVNESIMTVIDKLHNSNIFPNESKNILYDLLEEMKRQSLVVTSFH